jgi:hypothetical protein
LNFRNRLPAAVSASAATIAAVAIPSSAPAATASAAPSSSAPATAEAATAAPPATTASALTRRPGFVDDNVAAHEIVAVQSLDGAFGFLIAIDLDKSESARLP